MFFRKKIRVAIIEDERLSATAYRELIEIDTSFSLVGVGRSLASGVDICRKERPAVVMTDWQLGDGTGIDLIRMLNAELSDTRWLLLSAYSYSDMVHEAYEAGASGVMDKTSVTFEEVREALRAIAGGQEYFCPVSSDFLRRALPLIHPPLTPQEVRILKYLARHMPLKKIAKKEGLRSASTITEHIARIARKLDLREKPSAEQIILAARAARVLPNMPPVDGCDAR